MKTQYINGSVSHGTLLTCDLFEAFTSALGHCSKAALRKFMDSLDDEQNEAVETLMREDELDDNQLDIIEELVNETLPDLLNEFAPPFFYFGTHEGDGSDFGFWLSHDSLSEAIHSGEVARVDELPESLLKFRRANPDVFYFAQVSDHGNITLYDTRGNEIWSLV